MLVDSPDCDVFGWWERACNHMGFATLGNVALNVLIYAVTTIVADCSFRIMREHLTRRTGCAKIEPSGPTRHL